MKLKEVINKIEEHFVLPLAEDFDNVGLLCGNPERDINGILVCHDALETVVEEAIDKNVNLIICFHPIIFSGLKSITGKNYVERTILKAIENKIAIYAIHTAWDNDYYGVNYKICNTLGLINQKILMPKRKSLKQIIVYVPKDYTEAVKDAMFQAGAGNIGFYDECSFSILGQGTFRPLSEANPFIGEKYLRESTEEYMLSAIFEDFKENQILSAIKSVHPYEEVAYQIYQLENENQYTGLGRYGDFNTPMSEKDFLDLVKDVFHLKVIRHSGFNDKPIKRVGVLGGSGASGISAAIRSKCDAYLTGDIKYHDFFQSEHQMMVCDIGHFESEQFVVQQIFEILSENFTKFAILKSEVNTNPVNYYI